MRPLDVLIGAIFAGVVALAAWRAHALTRSGAIAAFVVGTITYAAGTIGFTLILLAFFVSSVVLSRFGRKQKRALTDVGKAGARDATQVLANGGIATACAVGFAFTHDARWALAFAGAYAAATADTWATELGTLWGKAPRSIVNFKRMATGMSGGVTLIGTGAEIAGALWMGVFAPLGILLAYMASGADFGWASNAPSVIGIGVREIAVVPIAGIAGATVDSLLGATLQELRRCDACDRTCETDPHACGSPTRLVRGLRGVSNDVVNLAATAAGAAMAVVLPWVLR
ncbi:MAG: hypothetical protein QOF71_448 [Candidatus Eremiobacteraeota bacterium]|jgi:uncharacterized protein (TIGR00297 family)|nr:hypothetical protein [Candidatus Eremiobacteraeota bacterium]